MDDTTREKLLEAGRIHKKAAQEARDLANPGTQLLEIAEGVEAVIRAEGAIPAFPVNIARNDAAAHFTPARDTDDMFAESDIVKIDIGVQLDGYIADAAITLNPDGTHSELIDVAQEALQAVEEQLEPGITISTIGEIICDTVEAHDLKAIRNLGGHYLKRYVQHADPSIPNARTDNDHAIEMGDVFAIEPFVTDGAGKVKEGNPGNIYKYEGGNARGRMERKVLKEIEQFNNLPFTSRWIDSVSGARLKLALNNLAKKDIIHTYGILKEVDGGMVAQAEHTYIMEEDGAVATTA